MKHNYFLIFIGFFCFLSCSNEKIETGNTLNKETVSLIKSLGLLEENEQIIKYYSNFEKDKAGSFFTTKRVAHYWLDDRNVNKNNTTFAFYKDIIYIDTIYDVPDTFSPYAEITIKDSTSFKAYVGGTRSEISLFFKDIIATWKQSKLR